VSVLAAVLGVIVGLALGTLGGGGSVLAVPGLVYVLGESPHQATTGSLIIVIASSVAGMAAHAYAGRVRIREGLAFGLAGLVTSVLSSAMSQGLPGGVVLVGFALVMVIAAVTMWRSAGDTPGDGQRRTTTRHTVRAVGAGAGIGVVIGVFGVGGGFLAVPALVSVAGFSIADAVGTSLLIIAVNATAALATRIAGTEIDWAVIGPFALAASAAAVLGQRVSARFSPTSLQRAFAVLLVVLAGWVLFDQLVLG
jgi:uncharacterized membrane protein YfcA